MVLRFSEIGVRICIFERDEALTHALGQWAVAQSHTCSNAFNVHALLHRFSAEVVDVLIVGPTMPSPQITADLEWLKATYPATKIILTTSTTGADLTLSRELETSDALRAAGIDESALGKALRNAVEHP